MPYQKGKNRETYYTLRELCPLLKKEFNIEIGYRRLYKLLRDTKVTSKKNYPLYEYWDKKYFYVHNQDIYSQSGRRRRPHLVATHHKILVSEKGILFLAQHISKNSVHFLQDDGTITIG